MQEVTFDVPGVSCEHCVHAITGATKAAGAEAVQVDLASKQVFLAFDPAKSDLSALKEAIEQEGYDITSEATRK